MEEWLALLLIFFLAGFIQGVTGFGAGLLAMPLLAFYLELKVAAPLCMLNGLIITGFLSFQLRNHVDPKKIIPLLIGCLPGIVIGVALLKKTNETMLTILLGLLLMAYAGHRLLFQVKWCDLESRKLADQITRRPKSIHRAWGYLAGFATGVISGAFSAGGPPTIIYTTLTGWSKDEIKATLSGFFFACGAATAIGHAVGGLTTMPVLRLFSITVVGVLAGVALGSFWARRFTTEGYIRLILMVLVILGLMMITTTLF